MLAKAQELKTGCGSCSARQDTPGTVGGTVPATLSLSLGTPAVVRRVHAGRRAGRTRPSTTANVISTAGDATLSVSDPSATATGRLVNGTFSLASRAAGQGHQRRSAPVARWPPSAARAPRRPLLTYSGPASNDAVTLTFSQDVGANEALRTGSYSKTLTFTLSTTTP